MEANLSWIAMNVSGKNLLLASHEVNWVFSLLFFYGTSYLYHALEHGLSLVPIKQKN